MFNYASIIKNNVSSLEWSLFGHEVLLSEEYANNGDIRQAKEKMRDALSISKVNGMDSLKNLCNRYAFFLVDKSDECDN